MSQTDSGKALLRQALYDGGQAEPVATATAVSTAYESQLAYAVEVKQEECIGYAPGWGSSNNSKHTSAPKSGYVPYTANPPHSGSWNGGPTGLPAGSPPTGFDASFFQDYDATSNQVQSLSHVENDIQAQRAEINRLKTSIGTWESKLSKARKEQPRLEKRIHRNENPRFFHYLQINRHDKVNKLKQTRDGLVSDQEQWTGSKQHDEGQLKGFMTALANSESLARTRDQLESKKQRMFDEVADSVSPTRRLNQINFNISEQTAALRVEQMLLDQVNGTLSTLEQVQKLYDESMEMLQRAARDNRTAQFVNFADAGDRGPDYFERMKQAQRDQLINAAQGPADQAYMLADRAWATFPSEARARYPTLAAQIGKAPMPRLRGANFGNTLMAGFAFGNIGDAINNAHASGKIEQNMQVIGQAQSIVATQTALVVALRDAIANNVAAMKGQLRTLTSQRVEERTAIFESIRARVMQQFGQQPPAVSHQKSSQDAFAPSAPPAW